MARAKKKLVAAPSASKVSSSARKITLKKRTVLKKAEEQGPIWAHGELYFSPLDLARYQLSEHKLANTLQGAQLKKHEMEAEIQRHNAEVRRLQVEIANLTNVGNQQKEELVALREELQKHYPVDFNEMTFDDVTGKIMIHGKPVRKE